MCMPNSMEVSVYYGGRNIERSRMCAVEVWRWLWLGIYAERERGWKS